MTSEREMSLQYKPYALIMACVCTTLQYPRLLNKNCVCNKL